MSSDIRVLGAVVLTALLPACASTSSGTAMSPGDAVPRDTLVRVDTVRVASEPDADTEARMARLEILLLERDARIRQLEESLDATRQEVVRNLAKLQSQASRAEAASGLAEAEIALQSLARLEGGASTPEYRQAQARIEESGVEVGRENYGGALYRSNQARIEARQAQARLAGGGGPLRAGETVFAAEVPLETGDGRTNVRSGPGLAFDVLFTLDPATRLTGRSYTDEWVRISDTQGREGWIFHTLVRAPR